MCTKGDLFKKIIDLDLNIEYLKNNYSRKNDLEVFLYRIIKNLLLSCVESISAYAPMTQNLFIDSSPPELPSLIPPYLLLDDA